MRIVDMGTLLSAGLSGKVLLCVGRSDMGTLLSEGQSGLEVLLCTWWGDMEVSLAHQCSDMGTLSVQGRVASVALCRKERHGNVAQCRAEWQGVALCRKERHGDVAQCRVKVLLCVGRSDMGTLLSAGLSGKVLLCVGRSDMGTLLSAGLSGKVLLCVGRSDMGTLLSAGLSGNVCSRSDVAQWGRVAWRCCYVHGGVT